MGTETPYPRLPGRFQLHIPNTIAKDIAAVNANLREVERWGNALPYNAVIVIPTGGARPSPVAGTIIYDAGILYIADGTNWISIAQPGAWTVWTPTITGWTAGNAVFDCAYTKIGRTWTARFQMTMGTTTAFAGSLVITTPFTGVSARQFGWADLTDISAPTVAPAQAAWAGTTITLNYFPTSVTKAIVAAAAPWAWATGDIIRFNLTGETTT